MFEFPAELPTQHTHITQGARLPDDCPACKNLWQALNVYVHVNDQLAMARMYVEDGNWDETELLEFLEDLEKTSQIQKYKRLNLGY